MTPPSQREARPRLRARRGDVGIAPYGRSSKILFVGRRDLTPPLVCAFGRTCVGTRFSPARGIPKRKPHPFGWGFLFGAGDEARTRYLDLGKVALYQMSYARKRKVNYTAYFAVCQPCIFVLREKIKLVKPDNDCER